MYKRILISVGIVGALIFTNSLASELVNQASPKVAQLIKKNSLEIVDYSYTKKAIGKGTKDSAKAILIDARPEGKYKKSTIPSSINIPDTKYAEAVKQLKGVAKNKEIIVFLLPIPFRITRGRVCFGICQIPLQNSQMKNF